MPPIFADHWLEAAHVELPIRHLESSNDSPRHSSLRLCLQPQGAAQSSAHILSVYVGTSALCLGKGWAAPQGPDSCSERSFLFTKPNGLQFFWLRELTPPPGLLLHLRYLGSNCLSLPTSCSESRSGTAAAKEMGWTGGAR